MSRLIGDFIFEVADSGGETTVGSHVGVADKTETQFEVEGFVERLVLKNAGANDLAGNGGEDFDSQLLQFISVNGCPSLLMNASGPLRSKQDRERYGTFQTEMLSMNLIGLSPLGPIMIRESPTLASLDQTTIASRGRLIPH